MWTSKSKEEHVIFELFKVALQVEAPWELKEILFNDKKQAWTLYMDFERGAELICPVCGTSAKAYDAQLKQWRHLDFWEWKTFMHVRVPRSTARCATKSPKYP
ncbi:MAG: hypothetical protein K0S39_4614 [Paenibacillus sp.]|jgi:transposase|nr:hypothetical protein [Paenibacillus sp.]